MNGFTVKPHHPSAQVQSAIVVEEHAFRHAEDRFPLKFQHSELRGEPLTTCPIRASVDNYTPLSEHLFEIGVLR